MVFLYSVQDASQGVRAGSPGIAPCSTFALGPYASRVLCFTSRSRVSRPWEECLWLINFWDCVVLSCIILESEGLGGQLVIIPSLCMWGNWAWEVWWLVEVRNGHKSSRAQTIRFGEGGPMGVLWLSSKAQIQAQDPEQSRYLNIGRNEARAGISMFWHGLRLFLYNKAKS